MNWERLISPVLHKELRERFRTYRGFLVLGLYLLAVGALLLGFIYLQNQSNNGYNSFYNPDQSLSYFSALSFLQLAMIGFVTPGLTAWLISNERERQTLNLLLTTQLSPSSIILSKLLSSLAFMALLVLATIPLYSVVTLYGGISPDQVVRVFAFFLLNMVFFGSVGVLLSTLMRRSSVATVVTYGVLFALVAGTGLLSEFLNSLWQQSYYQANLNPNEYYLSQEYTTVWLLRSINPAAVLLTLFRTTEYAGNLPLLLPPWQIYTLVYGLISVVLLWLSIYFLHPVRKGLLPFLRNKKA